MTQICTDEDCFCYGYCPDRETPEHCPDWKKKQKTNGDATGVDLT